MRRAANLALALTCAAVLAGCPYKIEIQQGNFISQEAMSQLKEGMSKEQVRQIMGTPLLVDIFHDDRWDYIFLRHTVDGRHEKRSLALFFESGKLARITGEAAPAPTSPAAGR